MTQEEKQLLLRDLCARLPYGVKIQIYDSYSAMMKDDELNVFHLDSTYNIEYRKLRPYLRPLSSMTEEEENEYRTINCYEGLFPRNEEALDYVLEHHFDYRGLIEKGLALEASEDMYKTE